MKINATKIYRYAAKNYRKYINKIIPYKQHLIKRKDVKISAYLSIYNDSDFIVTVLNQIKDYVDELIVVDGAYEWMVPYLEQLGIDPLRSKAEIYDAINASQIPYSTINKIWKNELEKRKTGYEHCSHRYVMRIDADEIIFFKDEWLEKFLGSECAVAEMQIPLYLTPGWVVGYGLKRIYQYPASCLLFDSDKISSKKHLEYLWLVVPADTLNKDKSKLYPVYEKPIAFCAHLSVWRTFDSAVNRAAFYIMNWMRKHGVIWAQKKSVTKVELDDLFKFIDVNAFKNVLERSHVAFGISIPSSFNVLVPSPLSDEQNRYFFDFYHLFTAWLIELNKKAVATPQAFIFDQSIYIDITNTSLRQAISSSHVVYISVPPNTTTVTATLVTMKPGTQFYVKENVECNVQETVVSFDISAYEKHVDALRQFIELKISGANEDICGYFKIMKDGV